MFFKIDILKKETPTFFPVKFAKFLRTHFFYRTPPVAAFYQFGMSFFHVAGIDQRGILIAALSFFLFHFLNSIQCCNQILKKTNYILTK